jgi:hypothetical protein
VGDQAFASTAVEQLSHRLSEVERRLRGLETAPRLGNAAIHDGALEVLSTADRATVLRAGILPDGNVGLASYDPVSGAEISRVGQPWVSAFIATAETTTARTQNTWLDLSTSGPSITVEVTDSGKVLLFFGADCIPGTNGTTSQLSFLIDGAAQSAAEESARRLFVSNAASVFNSVSLSRHFLVTGLTPGDHTFALRYQFSETSSGGSPPTWRNRGITGVAL